MAKSTKGEQLTALVSMIVAVVILAAGVTAHQTQSSSRNRLAQREDDLRLQIDLALSHNRAAMKQRLAVVDEVFNAWSHSHQSARDTLLLSRWIDEAIVVTMPGAVGELPPIPEFSPPRGSNVETSRAVETERGSIPTSQSAPQSTSPTGDLDASPAQDELVADILDAAPSSPYPTATGPVPALAETFPDPAEILPAPAQRSASTSAAPGTPFEGDSIVAAPSATSPPEVELLPTRSTQTPQVEVNLRQLHRQTEQYNRDLEGIDVLLKNRVVPLDEAGVEEFVEKLAILASRYEFLRLYYDGLSPEQRVRVSKPRGLGDTAERLQEQLKKLVSAADGDFLRPFDAERQPVLQALDQRLREIADTTSR